MAEKPSEEIELSLGLSLNGRFGVDPKSNLARSASSSMPNILDISRSMITRTSSLPVEAEEETRKRKEMQMLRRMEAKRKRTEKQRRDIIIISNNNNNNNNNNNGNGGEMEMKLLANDGKLDFLVKGVGFSGQGLESKTRFKNGFVGHGSGSGSGSFSYPPPLSQGSSASSSGTSDFDSQTPPPPGMNRSPEAKSPQSVESFSDENEPKRLRKTASVVDMTRLNPSNCNSETSGVVKNVLADMPCVSTKGEGPDGRRVEGFLYKYRKGEEVRIVCVCHGSFLTPAEFIKHAGGGDVDNPLRHIVVNPSPFL